MLSCEANRCPYWKQGFCDKLFPAMNKMGMCLQLYDADGHGKETWQQKKEEDGGIEVVETAFEEISNNGRYDHRTVKRT